MQRLAHEIYSFDEFRLDLTRGALYRGDEELKLRPKSFDVLKYLIENHGRLVSKGELIAAVWQEMAVTDDSLVQCMKDIRRALGDEGQSIVKTIPRRGYVFDKEVTENGRAIYVEETSGVHLVIEESVETNGKTAAAAQTTGRRQVETSEKPASRIATFGQFAIVTSVVSIILIVIAAGYGLYRYSSRPPAAPFRSVSIKLLTTDGSSGGSVISPDGNYVAFENQNGLWVRHVAAVNPVHIAPADNERYGKKTFSPDGAFIYYVRAEVLYQMPVLGGGARKVLERVNSAVTFSPDGKRFAFVRIEADEQRLVLANSDGSGEERTLAVRKLPDFFILSVLGNTGLAWSPDGATIACPGGGGGGFGQAYPVAVNVTDGTQKPMTEKRWQAILRMAWLADGTGLLMNAKDNGLDATRQIWHVPYPDGTPLRIYSDENEYETLSLSANSDKLVSVRRESHSNIWVIEAPNERTNAKQITFGERRDGYWGMDTTPDGKVVCDSAVGGVRDLWIMDADGGNQRQLTDDALMEAYARVSPDGRQVMFHLGGRGLWKMDVEGGNRKHITDGDLYPIYSPDGNWIVYSDPKEQWSLWKMSVDGGAPIRLTEHPAYNPALSPDGKWIAYQTRGSSREPVLRIIPFDGGDAVKSFATTQNPAWSHTEWTPDGRSITYQTVSNGIDQIVNQPVDGGQPYVLVSLKTESEAIREFAWSRDGKRLFFAAGPVITNVVMFDLDR